MGGTTEVGTTAGELANLVGGQIEGDPSVRITGAKDVEDADDGDVTFVADKKWAKAAIESRASAIVVAADFKEARSVAAIIRVESPASAFEKIVEHLTPPVPQPKAGIDPRAIISEKAELGDGVSVGPGCVIEAGAVIGARTVIRAGVYIGVETTIGPDCLIWPNVTIRERVRIGSRVIIHSGTVIGDDGFGYTEVDGKMVKLPQLGTVVIEDDVEIGSCVCIDRARFGRTYIGRNVKIDNLSQIAHNVRIGEGTIIVALAGIAGSVRIGKGCVIAGMVGIADHMTLGDGARVGAKSAVIKDVPAGETVVGVPAQRFRDEMRMQASLRHVHDMRLKLRALEKQLAELQENRD